MSEARELAAALGISRQMLHGIMAEKYPVSADMAVRLGYVMGNGPDIWLAMQNAHDLWHVKRGFDTSKLRILHP
jgi:antitoxin HigA-1